MLLKYTTAVLTSLITFLLTPFSSPAAEPATHVVVSGQRHSAEVLSLCFTENSDGLCVLTADKTIRIWDMDSREKLAFASVRTMRLRASGYWPIESGGQGRAYSAVPIRSTNRLAIAGTGWNNQHRGEIGFFDTRNASYVDGYRPFIPGTKEGLWEVRHGIDFSNDGKHGVVVDVLGRGLVWNLSSKAVVMKINSGNTENGNVPLVWPAKFIDSETVATAFPVSDSSWRIKCISFTDGSSTTLPHEHVGSVSAIAGCLTAKRLATADGSGKVFVWDTSIPTIPRLVRMIDTGKPIISSLALNPDGTKLAVGTEKLIQSPDIQLWEVRTGEVLWRQNQAHNVRACAFSPNNSWLAYGGGMNHQVELLSVDTLKPTYSTPASNRITKVQFLPSKDKYRLGMEVCDPAGNFGWRELTFSDTAGLKLDVLPDVPVSNNNARLSAWKTTVDKERTRLIVSHKNAIIGQIDVSKDLQGSITSSCLVPDSTGEARAIAVGTDRECGIYVYNLPGRGAQPELLLFLRDHSEAVTSLSASSDGKWLASNSNDGTLGIWSLSFLNQDPLTRRWGATLVKGNGVVKVKSVDPRGPLYYKGVRNGDSITEMRGLRQKSVFNIPDLNRLKQSPWDASVYFWRKSGAEEPQPFASKGGWKRTLGFHLSGNEWIAWTALGHYDSSPGGERLVGWLVNPKSDELKAPLFFSAEQVSDRFYSHQKIQNLLASGDFGNRNPIGISQVTPPTVKIVSPPDHYVQQHTSNILVEVDATPNGTYPILDLRVQVDGIDCMAHSNRQDGILKGFRSNPGLRKEFRVELQPGLNEITAYARYVSGEGKSDPIFVEYLTDEPPAIPTIYVVSIGVSNYKNFKQLNYAHDDAARLARVMEEGSRTIFSVPPKVTVLLDRNATKDEILRQLTTMRKDLRPRDVLVFFFSGHGISVPLKGEQDLLEKTCYLAPIDGDPLSPESTCISFSDILGACRNPNGDNAGNMVFFLDACHSGGFDIDRATRLLKRNRYKINVFASSTADQQSYEFEELRGGLFAHSLIRGLQGEADNPMDPDNIIQLNELSFFVTEIMQKLNRRFDCNQIPQVFTPDLYLQLTANQMNSN